MTDSWYDQEHKQELIETRRILENFWRTKIEKDDIKAVEGFKNFLKREFKDSPEKQKEIDILFQEAMDGSIGFQSFCSALQTSPLRLIYIMNYSEKIGPGKTFQGIDVEGEPHRIQQRDIQNLREYMQDKGISASISLRDSASGMLVTPDFPENKSSSSFAIHSVGKVFTGMLVLQLVTEGVLEEKHLTEPLKIDFIKSLPLPEKVQNHLIENKITLHQLMTHKAGVGDYLDNYFEDIQKELKQNGSSPVIKRPDDFLRYADDKLFEVGKEHYSNLGILLVGLAIQHAYKSKCEPCEYDDILYKYILRDAGISSLSPWKPKNGITNPDDPLSAHVVGGPAGGYWTTSQDLAKFGEWIYERSRDTRMKELISKYGQEFYNPEQDLISHTGLIPSSSACLTVSLKTGAVVATLSDQPENAIVLDVQVRKHVLSASDSPKSETPSSPADESHLRFSNR